MARVHPTGVVLKEQSRKQAACVYNRACFFFCAHNTTPQPPTRGANACILEALRASLTAETEVGTERPR